MYPIKKNVFGVYYSICDYSTATEIILNNAKRNNSFSVSALAVHGLIESYKNKKLNELVNSIDLVVPDGQPIRWALNSFYKLGLKDRVYGPTLTLYIFEEANKNKLKLFLYGSTKSTLDKLVAFINRKYPSIEIVGIHVDRFRDATPEEDEADIRKINDSGAQIVLVGRGCPRQEIWVAEHKNKVKAVMMAVGAAFDFHAGTLKQAPKWMQDNGLEWFYRVIKEPRRLWKRYLFTNSYFIFLFFKHKVMKGVHRK